MDEGRRSARLSTCRARAGEMAWRGRRDDSGVRHGRGELVFANGAREEGEFVHGTKQASRLCVWQACVGVRGDAPLGAAQLGAARRSSARHDAARRAAQLAHGYHAVTRRRLRQGRWVTVLADGARMEGMYVDGQRQGRWLCALADGRGWSQEWKDDVSIGETV